MKTQTKVSLGVVIVCCSLSSLNFVTYGPPKWVVLGKRTVDHKADRDQIIVTAARGDFNAIKLKVLHNAVNFKDVKIHFAKGTPQDVKIAKNIRAGGETRVIDIKGKDRVIKKVVFWYTTATPKKKKAIVELFGRH